MSKDKIKSWFFSSKKIVLVGIGNQFRKDDYLGLYIIKKLKKKVPFSSSLLFIECETIPENYLQNIIDFDPTHILLIDAAILGLKAGSFKLIEYHQIENFYSISTHMLPIVIFCEYLVKNTNAKVCLLAIQPINTDFGKGLTLEIKKSSDKIVDILTKIIKLSSI